MSIDGGDLVDILNDYGVPLGAATRCQWRQRELSKTILKNAFHHFERHARTNLIEPIVEFHELDFYHGQNVDTFTKRINDLSIVRKLQEHRGIYGFFEGTGQLIYVGKTESSNLLNEMTQRYNGKKLHFRMMNGANSTGMEKVIKDIAVYFSAYAVHPSMIRDIEALLTRLMINNTANLQVAKFTSELSKR
jgi:hypothetical protein